MKIDSPGTINQLNYLQSKIRMTSMNKVIVLCINNYYQYKSKPYKKSK